MADSLNHNGSGFCWGQGKSSGSGDYTGDGSGKSWSSGYGWGEGRGDGYEKECQRIELNILSHIPDSDLPLFIGAWEFAKTKTIFETRLKGGK